jgi:hypothetical protein
MSDFPLSFGSELYAATQEHVDLRYESAAQYLGGLSVEAAYEEEAMSDEVFASLTDTEQELYLEQEMERADDEDYMNRLLTLPQSQLTLANMDFLHSTVLAFGRVEGYQLSGVETGNLMLVANPIDLDNDTETLLDASLTIEGAVKLHKRTRQNRPVNDDSDPFIITQLVPDEFDMFVARQAVAKLVTVNSYMRASLED